MNKYVSQLYEKILVPIDGSDKSLKALKHAVGLARVHGSIITVISVIEELKLPFGAQYRLWANESHQKLIRNSLESINLEITSIKQNEPELKIDAEIIEGEPAKKIVETATLGNYDLIVMGKHGMNIIEELVMGSVTHKVINSSKIPVTVIA
jgi:nucleotide-binding universal stress UspA family protein